MPEKLMRLYETVLQKASARGLLCFDESAVKQLFVEFYSTD